MDEKSTEERLLALEEQLAATAGEVDAIAAATVQMLMELEGSERVAMVGDMLQESVEGFQKPGKGRDLPSAAYVNARVAMTERLLVALGRRAPST